MLKKFKEKRAIIGKILKFVGSLITLVNLNGYKLS